MKMSQKRLFLIFLSLFSQVLSENDVPLNALESGVSQTAEYDESVDLENASNNMQVSRYLGLGYNIFRGNPLSTHFDPGLKRNSFKPVKILRAISKPNSTCPELAQCLNAHEPEILESVHYVQSPQDYQHGMLDQLQLYGRVTSNVSTAFGVLERSFWFVNEQLHKGLYFVDHIHLSISQEADLDYRHSERLHPSFVTALCELPEEYHVDEYASFLREFGTHVVVKVREAIITVNRTYIDQQALRQAMQETGRNISVTHGGKEGFYPSDKTKNFLSRALEIMQTRGIMANSTQHFSSVGELPLVTGLRELGYFVTRDRISAGNPLSASCQRMLGQSTYEQIDARLENIRNNLEVALLSFAGKIVQDLPVLTPEFVPWASEQSPGDKSVRNTIELPPVVEAVPPGGSACDYALSFLGLGYDIFRGDLYAYTSDPGAHSSPPLLKKTSCSPNSILECEEVVHCTVAQPFTSTQRKAYVWRMEDYVEEVRQKFEFLGQLPDEIPAGLSSRSASVRTVRRLLADGLTFIDSIQANTSVEASATYRAMDQLDPNFAHALCELPLTYNSTAYIHILQEFGTHVITKVQVGNLTVERTVIPQATVISEALKNLNHQSAFEPITDQHQLSTLQLQTATDLAVKKARSFKRGGVQPEIVTEKTQVPIGYTLRDIGYFVTRERINAANVGDSCQHLDEGAVEQIKANLAQAMEDYGVDPDQAPRPRPTLPPPPSAPPTREVDRTKVWPSGTYGLLEAATGCPNGRFWHRGQRFHDSEDTNNRNTWDMGLEFLTSSSLGHEGIQLNFCTKTQTFPDEEPDWPQGSYCLYKKNSCPRGFQVSFLDHDDEDRRNGNTHRGVLPDGLYGPDTRYYFCCRADRDPNVPILLPTERPFFLLREGTRCQQVAGMEVHPTWLFSDCEDRFAGGCRVSGLTESHPGLTTRDGDWQWNFCYYAPVHDHGRAFDIFVRELIDSALDY